MRKGLAVAVAVAVVAGGAWYFWPHEGDAAAASTAAAGSASTTGGTTTGRGARGGRGSAPMPVESAAVSRHDLVEYITVVGNLIGQATVDVTPRIAGRLDTLNVKLGDRVEKGQQLAKVEDREIREQVNQSQANLDVNRATIVARENDVKLAETILTRAKTMSEQGLMAKQALEDAEARYNSALSNVAVAKAQSQSTQARLEELKVNLANTNIVSPVDGFVGKRNLDPGAFAGNNTIVFSVVDISTVRMIANLVEKDFRRVETGATAVVEVDAFPSEHFTGKVSRVAPIFDPATRTATMEIEVPNPGFRLKPGMYARVKLTADERTAALTVPRDAIVDTAGKHGVYVMDGETARFREVKTGISDGERVEVISGIDEGTRVVTIGALAIRDGDRITAAGRAGGQGGGQGRGGQGRGRGDGSTKTGSDAPAGTVAVPAPATGAAPAGEGRRGRGRQ